MSLGSEFKLYGIISIVTMLAASVFLGKFTHNCWKYHNAPSPKSDEMKQSLVDNWCWYLIYTLVGGIGLIIANLVGKAQVSEGLKQRTFKEIDAYNA